jgi:DNA polymerase sigma
MYSSNDQDLDLAYRYPFSKEAREIVANANAAFDANMMKAGRIRIDEALKSGSIEYKDTSISDLKYSHIMSYLYARMLVSALNNRSAVARYVNSEARRSANALLADSDEHLLHIANELSVRVNRSNGDFSMKFADYLALAPRLQEYSLVHQELKDGTIYLQKFKVAGVIETAIKREISKNLPIPAKELPSEVVQFSKTIRLPAQKSTARIDISKYSWIEKLLSTPIADVRHRTVNLILAPYLTNVRGMSEDESAKVIIDYIEKCKEVEPNTRINDSYIKYQCKYSKAKGSRPLSYDRAKELLKEVAEF